MQTNLKNFAFLILSFILAGRVYGSEFATSSNQYLVAYSTVSGTGVPRFFLEIDSSGRILRGPTKITEPAGSGAKTTGVLALPGKNPHLYLRRNTQFLYVLEIDSRSWKVVSKKSTSMNSTDTVDIANTGTTQVLVAPDFSGKILGYMLAPSGVTTGKGTDLAPGATRKVFGGVSADGRMVLFTDADKLFARTVNLAGQPTGNPRAIAAKDEAGGFDVGPADISNILNGAKRFAAYIKHPEGEFLPAQLFVRSVPSSTKDALGSEIHVADLGIGGGLSDIAIDPSGHFLLYSAGNAIWFQPLLSNGTASGSPRKLVSNDDFFAQIDIQQQ